jgi:glucose/arabinose dehydrogenase
MKKMNFYSVTRIVIVLTFLFSSIVIKAQTFPTGFSHVKVGTVYYPTAITKSPDGRLFICEKAGKVKVFKNGAILSTPMIQLSNVEELNERGLGGIAVDPSFSTNGYIYLYYTTSNPVHNRLSRFTVVGDVASPSSEQVLIDFEEVVNSIHNGGGMAFGPDGKLYLSMGDDKTSTNAQSLSTHKGKVLRLNKDGSGASGNPFTGSTAASRIWAYGFRNPFSLSIDPATGKLFVNDVGEGAWEEINNATTAGKNFGWPSAEGNSTNSSFTNPVFTYHHTNGVISGCAVSGGCFFSPSSTNYPQQYVGKYFFLDYCNQWINYIDPTTGSASNFASSIPGAGVGMLAGPDGNLYYMSISQNGLYKIVYSGSASPVITQQPMSQTVSAGQQAMFTVGASGASPLAYQWMKNDVNISGATSATYIIQNAQTANQGQYKVKVSNSAGTATSNAAALVVTAFNNAPVATISNPPATKQYRGGDTIYFSGSATDQEDGALPASTYTWVIEFHHDVHYHPGPNIPPGVASGSFVIPQTGESSANVWYRILLFVKDSHDGRDTVYRDVFPYKSKITLSTVPPGLQIALEGQPSAATYTVMAVENMKFSVEALSPQNLGGKTYTFNSWSQGGLAAQVITIPVNDATYTATFDTSSVTSCVAAGNIVYEYWSNINSSTLADIPFNTTPTGTLQLTKFEAPQNRADRFGARIRGYICAPATGNYIFYIASDNNSELWLSSNDNPAGKTRIAFVNGYTKYAEWAKYPEQQSAPVSLVQGQKYYVEVLHRENTEGDHVEVGWKLPNGTFERPMPGSYLSPFGQSFAVAITSPVDNSVVSAGSSPTIEALVSNANAAIQKVEFYANGNKLGEDMSSPYSFVWPTPSVGNYTLTAKALSSTTVTSQPVKVTVATAAACVAGGAITHEKWLNVTGTSISNIPVTTAPGYQGTLSQFKTISNSGDNYGERVRGFICPPATGNYTFWISSDDNSELYLSTDASPLNKQRIAYVVGYTQSQEYTKYPSQKSQPILLQANKKYYIEALHKEGASGDNLSVGWQLPSGVLERPIPGSRLAVFEDQQALTVQITSPPANSTVTAGSNIVLNATASGGSGTYTKAELFEEETKIGEDLSVPFTFTIQNAQVGTYHLMVKVTDSNSATAESADFHIYVQNQVSCSGTGEITRELWTNAPGTTVSDIPTTRAADVKQQLTIFKTTSEIGDNYGQRVRGYICPPVSGNYVFYISSDDNSELWLSTNEQPAAKQLVASVTGWTFPEEWNKYPSQQSALISLTAGNKYYVEALHKEGSQGDHLEVGWMLPDNSYERPVPGKRLIPFEDVPTSVCDASIQPGSSTTFCDGGSVVLNANTAPGYNYQWKKDGVEIQGATNPSYQATEQGAYQVRITYPGCNIWSAPENVTVNDFLTARITPGGPTTFCEGESVVLYGNTCNDYLYQWKRDGEDITGANSSTYVATVSGSYQLKIISGSSINWSALVDVTVNNCGGSAMMKKQQTPADTTQEKQGAEEKVTTVEEKPTPAAAAVAKPFNLKVFPNPTTGMFSFDYCIEETKSEMVQIKVISASNGEIVYRQPPERVTGCVRANIGLSSGLPIGVYVLQLIIGDKVESTKLVLCR